MSGKASVTISKDDTVTIPTGVRPLVRKCCNAALSYEKFKGTAEISVTFTDDERIRQLNKEFRDIDRATDVLSFPLGENGEYDINLATGDKELGDIVISVPHAIAQAEEYGHSLQREIGFLTVHSMLHLLGYDHVNGGEEEKTMMRKQEEILNKIGLTREPEVKG